jgi:hypothetical protein
MRNLRLVFLVAALSKACGLSEAAEGSSVARPVGGTDMRSAQSGARYRSGATRWPRHKVADTGYASRPNRRVMRTSGA